jgi:hypothetical protein
MHYTVKLWPSFAYTIDPTKPKMEVQAQQVQWVFGGLQASSCEDANIIGSRQAPVHLINALIFYFEALLYVLLDCALSL